MIKLHPSDEQLLKFAEGGLSATESILVSAHCDLCAECRRKVSLFVDNLSADTFEEVTSLGDSIHRDFISMFESITGDGFQPRHKATRKCDDGGLAPIPKGTLDTSSLGIIELEGRTFVLPPTLLRFADRLGEWTHLVGKIWQAQVEIGGGYLAQFIYMEKGGSVPEHTHKGTEMTLVIDGEFSDGLDVYQNGDFISLTDKHVHSPVSNVDEGCLVFSIIDQPLYFTSGWAKLINPLSNLYYQVHAHR